MKQAEFGLVYMVKKTENFKKNNTQNNDFQLFKPKSA